MSNLRRYQVINLTVIVIVFGIFSGFTGYLVGAKALSNHSTLLIPLGLAILGMGAVVLIDIITTKEK